MEALLVESRIVDPGLWSLGCGSLVVKPWVVDPGLWSLGCGRFGCGALDCEILELWRLGCGALDC